MLHLVILQLDSNMEQPEEVVIKSVYCADSHVIYNKKFYNDYVAAGTWPLNGIDISDEDADKFSGLNEPVGKRVGMVGGKLCWVDRPKQQPTYSELVEIAEQIKSNARRIADGEIAWLSDAVSSGIASDDEISDLAFWKDYRIKVMRLDTSKPPIQLPPDK